jgi:hypothetical protein
MNNKEFCIFILTHGRPDNVITYKTLKKLNSKIDLYLIIDNEDKYINEYKENFNNVIVFDKKKYADKIDEANNFDKRNTITHARNVCFDIAKELGYKYFIELDDDYVEFYIRINKNKDYQRQKIKEIDNYLYAMLEFYKSTNFLSIAMSQGGDWIGGENSALKNWAFKRKAMNSFICSVDRKFNFIGAFNEDVNTYTTLGSRGQLFGTIPFICLAQKATQSQKGGITELYKEFGTYVKSFTTVMMMPSSVKAEYQVMMGRIHHKIKWNNTVPKILNEKYKKSKL